jgi:hypothetical protein
MSQMAESSWVVPQAGIADILIPCLMTQNFRLGSAWSSCSSAGGLGYELQQALSMKYVASLLRVQE